MSHRDDRDRERWMLEDGEDVPDGTQGVVVQQHLFPSPAFRDLAVHYLESLQGAQKRPQTRKSEESYLRQALAWMEARGIKRPTTVDWQRYFDWRLSAECPNRITANTVETHRCVIRKVYARCAQAPRDGWLLIPNPVTTAFIAPYVKPHQARPRAMQTPLVTVPLILARMPDPNARALVEVLDNQGFRIQEALGIPLPGSYVEKQVLRARALDLDGGTLTILKQRDRDHCELSELKTGFSAATVELQPASVNAIREALRWRREQALLPRTSSRKGQGFASQNYVFPYFRSDLERLMGLHREVAPHDFRERKVGQWGGDAWHVYRHTFATYLARSGVEVEDIHKQLRHRDRKTTDAYLRALCADVRGSDAIRTALAKKKELQAQAVEERSGKGLVLVKRGDK